MTAQVQIKRNSHGNLSLIAEEWVPLFEFDYRKGVGAWLFWLRGERFTAKFVGPRKDFPMKFFTDACKAKYFLQFHELPDDIQIVAGGGHINVKNIKNN